MQTVGECEAALEALEKERPWLTPEQLKSPEDVAKREQLVVRCFSSANLRICESAKLRNC